MRRLGPLLAAIVLSSSALRVHAQEHDRATAPRIDHQRARAYFAAGTEAFETGQYRLALRAYREAYRAEPLPEIAFSMAQAARLGFIAERDPELFREALELYKQYIAEVPTGRRRAHAVQHIAALEAMDALAPARSPDGSSRGAIPADTTLMVLSRTKGAEARIDDGPTLTVPAAAAVTPGNHRIVVTAPGHVPTTVEWPAVEGRLVVAPVDLRPRPATIAVAAPPGATVSLDGRIVGEAPFAHPIEAPPGAHEVLVGAIGREPVSRTIDVAPGGHAKVDARRMETTDTRIVSYWLFAGGGALAIAGAVSGAVALAAEQRALDYERSIGREPKSDADLAAHEDDVATRDTARDASLVLLGASAAVAATGGIVLLVDAIQTSDPRSARPSSPRSGAVLRREIAERMPAPWVAPGTMGVAWRLPL